MRLRTSFFAIVVAGIPLAGCKQLPPGIPLDQLNPQQAQGHAVFQRQCARCHNDRTPQALRGPALYGMYRKQYLPSGSPANDERVTATILRGRNMMPPAGNSIDTQELNDLIAYLHTL